MGSTRQRSRTVRLLLGLGVAALVLLGAEVLARSIFGEPGPPLEVHLVPERDGGFLERSGNEVRRNYGAPWEEMSFPLQHEGPRFAVLGGSSVHEGHIGVGEEREFTQQLASQLGVTGLNLGSPGLDSHDLVEIVEELRGVELAALVIYAGHNDLGNVAMGRRYHGRAAAVSLLVQAGLERLQLFRLLRKGRPDKAKPKERGPPEPLSAADRAGAVRAFAGNLERIVELTAQRQRPLVLVVPASQLALEPEPQPCASPDCPLELYERAMALRGEDPEGAAALLRRARDLDGLALRASSDLQDSVRRLARDHDGVQLVDAPAELPREPGLAVPASELFSDPLHFSEAGHRAMAEAIAPTLAPLLGL